MNFDIAHRELSTELPDVQNRLVLNHAQVLAWAMCLPLIFGEQVSQADIQNIKLHLIGRAQSRQNRLKADHPMVAMFWDVYEAENLTPSNHNLPEYFNHSKDTKRIAINLVDFEKKCVIRGIGRSLDFTTLKRLLPQSQVYRFEAQKTVKSQLENEKTKHCWVFVKPESKRSY